MTETVFSDLVRSQEELRTLIGEAPPATKNKGLKELDGHCLAFIARSPFLLIGTMDAQGRADVSPRGDPPGFVQVLDSRHIAIPERPGNRRADSLTNILHTGSIGVLFLIPGIEDIFRLNGRACITRDPALLQKMEAMGKVPLIAIGIEIEECFFHCAKAIKRSQIWNPDSRQNPDEMASGARIAYEQYHPEGMTLEDMERLFAESYAKRLY